MTSPPACWRPSPARCRGCWFRPAQSVTKGEALAAVVFARLCRRGQHLSQGARHRPECPQAGRSGQGPAGASGRLASAKHEQAETDAASAEADRDAALQALQSLNVDPQAMIRDTRRRQGHRRAVEGLIRSPHRRHGGGKADHAGPAAAGGHHAGLHRRRPFPGLGDGADLRFRPRRGRIWRQRPGDRRAAAHFPGTVDNIAARGGSQHPLGGGARVVDNPGDFLKRQMYVQVRIDDAPGRATACWFRSRPSCATTKICPLSMSSRPTAASPRRM